MYGNLTQPKVDHYIEWLRRNDHFGMTGCIYDDKSNELLDELFSFVPMEIASFKRVVP